MRMLLLIFLVFIQFVKILPAGESKIIRRHMTTKEFLKIKSLEGVYQKGVNYNKIVNGHGTGLKPPTEEKWQELFEQTILIDHYVSEIDVLPSSHDNSNSKWFPPIGNQDGEGSCVSWACGYYTKTFQEAREHHWDLSACTWDGGYWGHPNEAYQEYIFSPDFIYHQVNNGVDNGSYYSDNMNLLERIGCCTWNYMPYDPADHTTWPSEAAWQQAPWYRSETGYGYMYVDTDEKLQELKQLLADSNLAIISINADYYNQLTDEDLWTLDNYNPDSRNHANTVVGYDDNYGPYEENGNPNTYGAFKVANSWGVGGSWENVDDGFYYISYECMKQRVQYIFYYENKIDYHPDIMAVFHVSHDYRGECNITLGIGAYDNPDSTKSFNGFTYDGGNAPFCENNIIVDITEFDVHKSGGIDNYFLELYDGGSETVGIIDTFTVEMYDDYASGHPKAVYISQETPKQTIHNSTIYVQLQTDESQMPNLIDGGESAGWQHSIVLSDQKGEFQQDGTDEPFPAGYYFINSVITNDGNANAFFDQNRSVWKIFLDDSLIQNWGWWNTRGAFEIFYHDGSAYSGFSQKFEKGYGVVFDLSGYQNVALDSVDFAHYGWQFEHGPYYYNLHVYDWKNKQEILTLYNLEAGDSYSSILWEEGIVLGGLEGSDSVGVFVEPLSGADYEALPGLLTDGSAPARTNTSFIIDINDPFNNYTELSSAYPNMGDFLVNLWITGDTIRPEQNTFSKTTKATSIFVSTIEAHPKPPIPFELRCNSVSKSKISSYMTINELSSDGGYVITSGQSKAGYASDSVYLKQGTHILRMEIDADDIVKENDETDNSYSRVIQVGPPSDVTKTDIIPLETYLYQNYPNPFNPITAIRFALPRISNVKLEVYNLLGQKVVTLVNGRKAAGYHQVTFNGSRLPSGVYYYRLVTDRGGMQIRKMVLLK